MGTYPMDYSQPFDPRFRLFDNHYERNFKALEIVDVHYSGKR